jgi:SOS-response transcriptional repressor LexA
VQAGHFTETKPSEIISEAERWVETSLRVSENSFALDVQGDSMTNPMACQPFRKGLQ